MCQEDKRHLYFFVAEQLISAAAAAPTSSHLLFKHAQPPPPSPLFAQVYLYPPPHTLNKCLAHAMTLYSLCHVFSQKAKCNSRHSRLHTVRTVLADFAVFD